MVKSKRISVLDSFPTVEAAEAVCGRLRFWLVELSLVPRFTIGVEHKLGCYRIVLEDRDPQKPLPHDLSSYQLQMMLIKELQDAK